MVFLVFTATINTTPEPSNLPLVTQTQHPEISAMHPSLFASFTNFARIFFAIITNKQFQRSFIALEELIQSLVNITFMITQNKSITYTTHKNGFLHIEQIEPATQKQLEDIITQQARLYITRGTPLRPTQAQIMQKEEDTQIKIILGYFAGIVNSFFTIVQDPENRSNVAPQLVNMLSGIINIGTEVMKRNALPHHPTPQDIAYCASQVDAKTKRSMLAMLQTDIN